jgi:hypothetical protein
MEGYFTHWVAQAPGLILALLSYVLIARLVLEPVLGGRGANRFVRAFCRLTDPVVHVVGAITPRAVPDALVTGCAIVWVFAARIVLVQVMAALAMSRIVG